MILLDAPVHVGAAVLAGVADDDGFGVDGLEFGFVGCDGEVVAGDYADDAEEGAVGFPAFGAAAGVVELDVGIELNFDGVAGALALDFAAGLVGVAFCDAVVDEGVDGGHCGWCIFC